MEFKEAMRIWQRMCENTTGAMTAGGDRWRRHTITERERLAELIHKAELLMWGKPVGDAKAQREFLADYLIAHGVIIADSEVIVNIDYDAVGRAAWDGWKNYMNTKENKQ